MKATVLQRIPETNKFRLKGLTKEQIEILKKNKGNVFKALFLIGGTSLVTQVIGEYNAMNPELDPIPLPEIPEIPEIPNAPAPVNIEPEVPDVPEIVNVIDVEDTIETFEELEFDDDIIEEVLDDIDMPELQEIDAEMEEYLNSEELITDLNEEDYDEIIINADYIDDELEFEIDEEGFVVEDDEYMDDIDDEELIDESEEDVEDEDFLDEESYDDSTESFETDNKDDLDEGDFLDEEDYDDVESLETDDEYDLDEEDFFDDDTESFDTDDEEDDDDFDDFDDFDFDEMFDNL